MTDAEKAKKAERNREKQSRHYYAHREEEKARRAKYREQHREEEKARKREYRLKLKAAGIQPVRNRSYDPIKAHEEWIRKRFGLSAAEYAHLYASQSGCAICGAETSADGRRLAVDHDHVTGAVRGLLCRSCNWGLGYFQDDPARLARAIEYLHRSRSASLIVATTLPLAVNE